MQVQSISNTPDRKTKIASASFTVLGTILALNNVRKGRGAKNLFLTNFNEKEIFGIASGAVCGGLVGGTIADSKNAKAKLREGITQLFGNTLIPLLCVSSTINIYKNITKKQKGSPLIILGALSLIAGILLGNKVCNFINEKIFHNREHRKIKPTDFAPHIDDTCMALSLILRNKIGDKLGKIVPFALTIGGYNTGTAKEFMG